MRCWFAGTQGCAGRFPGKCASWCARKRFFPPHSGGGTPTSRPIALLAQSAEKPKKKVLLPTEGKAFRPQNDRAPGANALGGECPPASACGRSEESTSEIRSLMSTTYAVFSLNTNIDHNKK